MIVGAGLAWSLVNAKHVLRKDGSKVIVMKHPTWKSEFLGMWETLFTDWYIVLLFPMFFVSNWFYTYHFQSVNLAQFTLRTRSLNGVLYWMSQMIGAGVFGVALDFSKVRRTVRAKAALGALLVITMGKFIIEFECKGWILTMVQLSGVEDTLSRKPTSVTIPPTPPTLFKLLQLRNESMIGLTTVTLVPCSSTCSTDSSMVCFFSSLQKAISNENIAAWQTTVYWLMGSLTNNSRKLANFAGFYKGIQSAGSAISPVVNNQKIPYMTEFAINWGLLAASLAFAAPVVWAKVRGTLRFPSRELRSVVNSLFRFRSYRRGS